MTMSNLSTTDDLYNAKSFGEFWEHYQQRSRRPRIAGSKAPRPNRFASRCGTRAQNGGCFARHCATPSTDSTTACRMVV